MDLSPLVAAAALSIEAKTWLYRGVKEAVVRDCLGLSMTHYYLYVARLIDTELALQLDPHTTTILRRRRDARAA